MEFRSRDHGFDDAFNRAPNERPIDKRLPDPVRDAETGSSIPDDLVDAFFDGEMSTDRAGSFFNALRKDPAKAREVVGMQRALSALRDPVKTPDLSASILANVGKKKGWTSDRGRLRVTLGRLSAAAALLLMVGGALVAQRVMPGMTPAGQAPAPINDLARAVPSETAHVGRSLASAVQSLGDAVQAAPVLHVTTRIEQSTSNTTTSTVHLASVRTENVSTSPMCPASTEWVANIAPASAAVIARVASIEVSTVPEPCKARRTRCVSNCVSNTEWSMGETSGLRSWALPAGLTRTQRDSFAADAAVILPGR